MNTFSSAALSAAPAPVAAVPHPQLRVLCGLFFFSGLPALIYQLVWQRALLSWGLRRWAAACSALAAPASRTGHAS